MTKNQLIEFIEDVAQIAKYLSWKSEVGDTKAMELIEATHKGKYGSYEGIWPQFDQVVEELRAKLP
jgi:hypothetical protein